MCANVTHLDDFIDLVCMSPVAVAMLDARRKNDSKCMHFAIHHFVVRLQCTIFGRREEGARWILCVLFRPWCVYVWQRLHIIYVSLALSLCVSVGLLGRSSARLLAGCECACVLCVVSWFSFICSISLDPIWKTNKRTHIWCMNWAVSRIRTQRHEFPLPVNRHTHKKTHRQTRVNKQQSNCCAQDANQFQYCAHNILTEKSF